MHKHWYAFENKDEFSKYKNRQICFSFRQMSSVRETYDVECEGFHLFDDGKKGKDDFLNIDHPGQPDGTNCHCKICGKPEV